MEPADLAKYPLCSYFFAQHLSVRQDDINFPSDQPGLFERYEKLLASGLDVLSLTKEQLRSRSEFNFESGNSISLETAIAVLRVVETLRLLEFQKVELIEPMKNLSTADIICEKNGQRVCIEVKTISKQGAGRRDLFIEDTLYEKIVEIIGKAKKQLCVTASVLSCSVKLFACVVNWFDQSIYMSKSDYQNMLNRLESDQNEATLAGVDGVLFVTKMGEFHLFLNEQGRLIDSN